MPENKVQFNIKNVHYAVQSVAEGGAVSWSAPVAVPGAVSLSLDAAGEITPFYADGIVYYASAANNGYEGDLEMARFPVQMLQDIWKQTMDSNNVLTENSNVEFANFALLFQIDGDKDNEFYLLYNCAGTRPGINATTNTDTKEPNTQTSTISATPLADGRIMARTTGETDSATKEAWFSAVYVAPAAAAAQEG